MAKSRLQGYDIWNNFAWVALVRSYFLLPALVKMRQSELELYVLCVFSAM